MTIDGHALRQRGFNLINREIDLARQGERVDARRFLNRQNHSRPAAVGPRASPGRAAELYFSNLADRQRRTVFISNDSRFDVAYRLHLCRLANRYLPAVDI